MKIFNCNGVDRRCDLLLFRKAFRNSYEKKKLPVLAYTLFGNKKKNLKKKYKTSVGRRFIYINIVRKMKLIYSIRGEKEEYHLISRKYIITFAFHMK